MSKIKVADPKPGKNCRIIRLYNRYEVRAAIELEAILHGFKVTVGESGEKGMARNFVPINNWANTVCRLINLRAHQIRNSRDPLYILPSIDSFLEKYSKNGS